MEKTTLHVKLSTFTFLAVFEVKSVFKSLIYNLELQVTAISMLSPVEAEMLADYKYVNYVSVRWNFDFILIFKVKSDK